jgi:hypothetical protein
LVEWRDGEEEPANSFFSSLPERTRLEVLARITTQRWRTERIDEDLNGKLGFDHLEGRRFPGWHHHVSVALCCDAFVVAERKRIFPPAKKAKSRWCAPLHGQSATLRIRSSPHGWPPLHGLLAAPSATGARHRLERGERPQLTRGPPSDAVVLVR